MKNNVITTFNPFFDFFLSSDKKDYAHSMDTDIIEYNDRYEMKINLPNVEKENIKLKLEDGYLKVEASFDEKTEEEKKYIYRERKYGSFARSYYVGDEVKYDHINAKLDKGVLTLTIKKTEPVKEEPQYINID
ncbi:MAG: Hsp20 family protein [Erysipelotrichaceae bacterium]|nr:Hsp20 family protein [Erysipelotrichaceae bacterium]